MIRFQATENFVLSSGSGAHWAPTAELQIANYNPTPDDLDYPAKLEKVPSTQSEVRGPASISSCWFTP